MEGVEEGERGGEDGVRRIERRGVGVDGVYVCEFCVFGEGGGGGISRFRSRA